MIYYLIVTIMVVISFMLVGIILLQQSKSGGMGTAMGQSAMNAAFGGQGADKLLTKITAGLAGSWMFLALLINFLNHPDVDVSDGSESVVTQRAVGVIPGRFHRVGKGGRGRVQEDWPVARCVWRCTSSYTLQADRNACRSTCSKWKD